MAVIGVSVRAPSVTAPSSVSEIIVASVRPGGPPRLAVGRRPREEPNLARRVPLGRADPPEPDELEEGEEGDHHFGPALERAEQLLEYERLSRGQGGLQPLDLLGDRELLARDFDRPRGSRVLEHGPERAEEIEERDGEERLPRELRERIARAQVDVVAPILEAAKAFRGGLEF